MRLESQLLFTSFYLYIESLLYNIIFKIMAGLRMLYQLRKSWLFICIPAPGSWCICIYSEFMEALPVLFLSRTINTIQYYIVFMNLAFCNYGKKMASNWYLCTQLLLTSSRHSLFNLSSVLNSMVVYTIQHKNFRFSICIVLHVVIFACDSAQD